MITITTLHGEQDFNAFVSTHPAVIVEFMTSWCGACKGIEDYFEELSLSSVCHDHTSSHQDEHQDLGVGAGLVRSAKVFCDKNKDTKILQK